MSSDTVKKNPLPLDAQAAQSGIHMAVRGLIIVHGPGSWTEAAWDEYLVILENHSTEDMQVESAALEDFLGVMVPAGFDHSNPRVDLFNRSMANLQRYNDAKAKVKKGDFPVSNIAIVAGTMLTFYPLGLLAAPAVVPAMEKEAHDGGIVRQIALPAAVPGRHATSGSLFFPVTAGPTRLIIRARRGDEPLELSVKLPTLATLHLEERK
jgi:hypothetical protein